MEVKTEQLARYADTCRGCKYEDCTTIQCPKNEQGELLCNGGLNGYIWIDKTVNKVQEPTGTKHDSDKPRFDLVPADALLATTRVITYGENKYPAINGVQNWRKLENANQRLFAAAQRHLWAYQTGERLDESGENHLAHAISSLMFMLQLDIEKE